MKRSILTWVGIVDSDVIGGDIIFGTKHGVPEMKSIFLSLVAGSLCPPL